MLADRKVPVEGNRAGVLAIGLFRWLSFARRRAPCGINNDGRGFAYVGKHQLDQPVSIAIESGIDQCLMLGFDIPMHFEMP
jgi:hypothetical protein